MFHPSLSTFEWEELHDFVKWASGFTITEVDNRIPDKAHLITEAEFFGALHYWLSPQPHPPTYGVHMLPYSSGWLLFYGHPSFYGQVDSSSNTHYKIVEHCVSQDRLLYEPNKQITATGSSLDESQQCFVWLKESLKFYV